MDIKDGRVVKGTHFKDLVDSGDPLNLARKYARQGADELVLLDIVATVEERKNRAELVREIAEAINIPFSVGGGVGTVEDVKELLDAGADKVSIGSAAVTDPGFVKEACNNFGSQAIIISIDPKKSGEKWEVYIKGGRENTVIYAIDFAEKMEGLGVGELLVNSLDRDGTKQGFDIELLDAISKSVNIPVIASSGAGSVEDFVEVFKDTSVTAALGASVFHNSEFTVGDVKVRLKSEGIAVR
jgi:cyclase